MKRLYLGIIVFLFTDSLYSNSLANYRYSPKDSVETFCMECCESAYNYLYVEERPVFEGGETDLMVYTSKNFTYPISDIELNSIKEFKNFGFMTKIYIYPSGKASDCGVSSHFLRTVVFCGMLMKDWKKHLSNFIRKLPPCKPGKMNGHAVPIRYFIPFPWFIHIQKFKEVTDLDNYKNISDIKLLELQEEHVAAISKLQSILLRYQTKERMVSFLQIYVDEEGEVVFAELNAFSEKYNIQEIFGIIKTMPIFTPYEIDGKKVPIKIILPNIEF